jgi:hypothetical protein
MQKMVTKLLEIWSMARSLPVRLVSTISNVSQKSMKVICEAYISFCDVPARISDHDKVEKIISIEQIC